MRKTLILLLVFVLASAALAQEATPEAELPPAAPGIDWQAWLDRVQTAATISFIIGGILGAAAGGGSALVILSRIDRQTKDQTERLFESLSPEWQATIVRVVQSAEEAVRTASAAVSVLREVTDGKPNG